MLNCCIRCIKSIDAYLCKADDDLEEQLTAEGFLAGEETVKTINEVEEAVTVLLESYGENVVKKLNESVDLKKFFEDEWPKIKHGNSLGQELQKLFANHLKRAVRYFAKEYIQQIDPELTISAVTHRTTSWVTEWSESLADLMKLNTNEAIEQILVNGLEKGKGVAEIARQLSASGICDPGYRARTTALTETLRAHSVAQQEAFDQNPAVSGKRWRHTGSYRNNPRKNHETMDGQVVPKDKPFKLIGAKGSTYTPMFPRDPILPAEESVNCHCLQQPVVDESVFGLSLEERQKLQREAIELVDKEWAETHKKADA